MPHSLDNLRTILVCDDIRDEIGGKHSVMGILAGDIVIGEFPASIFLAIYMQYFASKDETGKLTFTFRLVQGETEMAQGKMEGDVTERKLLNLIFPKALASFERETTFRIFARLNGSEEREILTKKIVQGTIA